MKIYCGMSKSKQHKPSGLIAVVAARGVAALAHARMILGGLPIQLA